MTTQIQKITANIQADKELSKKIAALKYYSVEQFIKDGQRYIKAIKEGRMINSIGSVSSSGMSRTMKFLECAKHKGENRYQYYQFWSLFKALGHREAKGDRDYFSIGGCGMDMVFATNYNNIHKLRRLGFINKQQCERLAQKTPTTI